MSKKAEVLKGAIELINEKRYREALREINLVITLSKKGIGAKVIKYEIYRKLGEYNNALGVLNHIIIAHPKEIVGYDLKLNFLYEIGDYQECSQLIDLIIRNFCRSDYTYLWECRMLWINKKYKEGLEIIEEGIKKSKISEEFLIEKAKIYGLTDKISEGINILKTLSNKNRERQDVLFYLGILNIAINEKEESLYYFERLEALKNYESNQYLMGCYYYSTLTKDEIYPRRFLMKLSELSLEREEDSFLLMLKALVNCEIGAYKKSLEIINKMSKTYGENADIHGLRGIVYSKQGLEEKSKIEFENFFNKEGKSKELIFKYMIPQSDNGK